MRPSFSEICEWLGLLQGTRVLRSHGRCQHPVLDGQAPPPEPGAPSVGTEAQQVLPGAASEAAAVHRIGGPAAAAAAALRSLGRKLQVGVRSGVRVSRKCMQELPLLQPPQQLSCRQSRSQLEPLPDTQHTSIMCPVTEEHIHSACEHDITPSCRPHCVPVHLLCSPVSGHGKLGVPRTALRTGLPLCLSGQHP